MYKGQNIALYIVYTFFKTCRIVLIIKMYKAFFRVPNLDHMIFIFGHKVIFTINTFCKQMDII